MFFFQNQIMGTVVRFVQTKQDDRSVAIMKKAFEVCTAYRV